MSEQLALLPGLLTAHLQLTLMALLVGIAVSVPAGVLVTRVSWLETPVLGAASVIQTVPSLALLAIMVPVLASLNLESIGFLPAFIGLCLYSVLPILRNTVTGLAGVDAALLEAARGVGMTRSQRLWRVELPLAMPVVIAGVRTATVWTVGMATLSTPVGAPSLGNYIFSGLQTRNDAAVLVGCVAAAGLALALDGLVRGLDLAVRQRRRGMVTAILLAVGTLYLYAGATLVRGAAADGRVIKVGAKTFTEQYILSQALALRVERKTGLPAEVVGSLGSTVAFDALGTGELDAYVDYTGTIWATIMKRKDAPSDHEQVLREVRDDLERHQGIELLGPLGFENAYAFAMRKSEASRLGARRISDLIPLAPRLAIGADYEFFGRPEWRSIQDKYALAFRERRSMDPALMYQAAAQGNVDVITAFSTDGRIASLGLSVLADDRGAIPPYDAVILVSPRLRREHPEVIAALRGLLGTIDADEMRRLNREVDEKGLSPREVAREYLDSLAARR
jgi:osmoprotectant transport system substrate-binding protein/osmoprotectant transport system permease protein